VLGESSSPVIGVAVVDRNGIFNPAAAVYLEVTGVDVASRSCRRGESC
jgi:hypothetical protein